MAINIELVKDGDWPTVRTLIVESLQDLEFYKDLEADANCRKNFLNDYMHKEYLEGKSLFWCGKVERKDRVFSPAISFSDVFIAGKLILPSGFVLNEVDRTKCKISSEAGAKMLLSPIISDDTATGDRKISFKGNNLLKKYPKIIQNLDAYKTWYNSNTQKITNCTGWSFWQCNHIAVAPEYRKTGMAATGLQEVIKTFSALADATGCHLVLANTGIPGCRFVCSKSGFSDVATLRYQCKPRWLMALFIDEDKNANDLLCSIIRNALSISV